MGNVSVQEEIRQRREDILRVAARHGAGNVRLFGSVARGEETIEIGEEITNVPGLGRVRT